MNQQPNHNYFEDSTPDNTAQTRAARASIMREVKRLKSGESVTYGALSRKVERGSIAVFEVVLMELAADAVIRWNRHEPSPSRVYRV